MDAMSNDATRAEEQDAAAPAAPARPRRKRERPLLIVNTGHGKGKSTAAFGLVLRAWAQGWRVGVYQFVKSGKWRVGEQSAAAVLAASDEGGTIDWFKMGDGWSWTSRDLAHSADLAREGWAEVRRRLDEQTYDLLVLDEFTYPLQFGWLDVDEVVAVLQARPGHQHVVVTGRDAPAALVDAADLVSEVVKHKHPFDDGHRGQKGIEW